MKFYRTLEQSTEFTILKNKGSNILKKSYESKSYMTQKREIKMYLCLLFYTYLTIIDKIIVLKKNWIDDK